MKIMMTGFKALWGYEGLVVDMGIKPDKQTKKPIFYVLTEALEPIQVTVTDPMNIAMVRDWLDNLNTGVDCEFKNYVQFMQVIEDVFKIYAERQGMFLNYDNTYLLLRKKQLNVTDKTIARYAGVGKSTVNDLTRGQTKHPRFHTVCKIHSALRQLAGINGQWD